MKPVQFSALWLNSFQITFPYCPVVWVADVFIDLSITVIIYTVPRTAISYITERGLQLKNITVIIYPVPRTAISYITERGLQLKNITVIIYPVPRTAISYITERGLQLKNITVIIYPVPRTAISYITERGLQLKNYFSSSNLSMLRYVTFLKWPLREIAFFDQICSGPRVRGWGYAWFPWYVSLDTASTVYHINIRNIRHTPKYKKNIIQTLNNIPIFYLYLYEKTLKCIEKKPTHHTKICQVVHFCNNPPPLNPQKSENLHTCIHQNY